MGGFCLLEQCYFTKLNLCVCGKSQNGKGYNKHTCTIKFIAESSITMILYRAIKAKNNSQFSYLIHGGPRGRVVKVADFSALDHSIISPMWVRAPLGARVTYGTSQVLLAGVSGGFPRVLRFSPHLPIDPSRYE